MEKNGTKSKVATFGGGCFWGVEERFRKVPGVTATTVGYMGGTKEHPTYEEVCGGDTGHTEVVEVTYDPKQVSYDQLLNIFFSVHDPTQVDRQGPDIGRQYRSVVFYHTDEQRVQAEEAIRALEENGQYKSPIATVIEPAGMFWRAEDYHQQYLAKLGKNVC